MFLFYNSVLRPFQDYFSLYETGLSVGGRKRENPVKNHLEHPQSELGLSHMWPERGSNPHQTQRCVFLTHSLRKLAHTIFKDISVLKVGNFAGNKVNITLMFAQNIDCGYMLKHYKAALTSTHNLCFGSKLRQNVYPHQENMSVKSIPP